MSDYIAPARDITFALNELANLPAINQLEGFEDATPDLVDAIVEEASKLATGVLSPLNKKGDETVCTCRK